MADDQLKSDVAAVAASYFAHSHIPPDQIASVIKTIASSLAAVTEGVAAAPVDAVEQAKPSPAVPIRSSVKPDSITCLVCGKFRGKTLRRHISTSHDMEPGDYRAAFGLKPDYPMTAPNYSAARSEMARKIGLGAKSGRNRRPAASDKKGEAAALRPRKASARKPPQPASETPE